MEDTPTRPSSRLHRSLQRSGIRLLWWLSGLVFGVVLGILTLSYFTAGSIYEFEDSVDLDQPLPDVDAIVCLAGGRGRIQLASDIWNRYRQERQDRQAPVLYLSGMGKHSNWDILSVQIRPDVLKYLQFRDVVIETESLNTDENAEVLKQFAVERKWYRFLLITSSYHMKRARYIMVRTLKTGRSKSEQAKLEIETLSVHQEPFTARDWRSSLHGIRVTLVEYLKWVVFRIFWDA